MDWHPYNRVRDSVPVSCAGNMYNIPLQLWIMDSHPYNPPMVYVRPTNTMQIKSGRYVDMNGKVDMPFLREWRWVRMPGWLAGWLAVCLSSLAGWLSVCLAGWLSGWLCQSVCLADCLWLAVLSIWLSGLSVCLSG